MQAPQKTETGTACSALACHGYIKRAAQTIGPKKVERIRRLVYQERRRDNLPCDQILKPFHSDLTEPKSKEKAPWEVQEGGQKRKTSLDEGGAEGKRQRLDSRPTTGPANAKSHPKGGPQQKPDAVVAGPSALLETEVVSLRPEKKTVGDQARNRPPKPTDNQREASQHITNANGRPFYQKLQEAYRLTA